MKEAIVSLALTIVLVFGIPLAAILFASEAGMAICVLSFYIINPLYSIGLGIYAAIKKRWPLSLIPAVIYLPSMWILFEIKEPVFAVYSLIYLTEGLVSTIIAHLFFGRQK